MNLSKHLRMTAVTAGLVMAGMANAAGVYVTNSSGAWSNSTIWTLVSGSGGAIPNLANGDSVTINHDVDVTDSRNAYQVTVSSGKTLHVTSSGDFTLGAGGGTVNGTVEVTTNFFATASSGSPLTITSTGKILLDGATPRLQVNMADAIVLNSSGTAKIQVDPTPGAGPDAYIEGTGSIRGENDADSIEINMSQTDTDVELRLDGAKLHGRLTITNGGLVGPALFDNRGFVVADVAGGTILMDMFLDSVTDTSNGCASSSRWQSTTACAAGPAAPSTLEFDTANASGLVSEFYILGELKIDGVDVITSNAAGTEGYLYLGTSGRVSPVNGGQLYFAGWCPSSCTSSPSSPIATQTYCNSCP